MVSPLPAGIKLMSYLAHLFGEPASKVSRTIDKLEQASGQLSLDVRLISTLQQKTHQAMTDLGLDPLDTTPTELHHSLQVRATRDDKALQEALNLTDNDSQHALEVVTSRYKDFFKRQNAWKVKKSSVKKLLLQTPPRAVMEKLRYRSATSLVKNEQVNEILAAARFMEPAAWQTNLAKRYHHLTSQDFEHGSLEVSCLSPERWPGLARSGKDGAHLLLLPELGSVVCLPSSGPLKPGFLLLLAWQYVSAHTYLGFSSLMIKLHRLQSHPGWLVKELHNPGDAYIAKLAGQPINWEIIAQSLRDDKDRTILSTFNEALDDEDLSLPDGQMVLQKTMPELKWWGDYLQTGAVLHKQPVSVALGDAAINLLQGRTFTHRSLEVMRRNLWRILLSSYAAQPVLARHLVSQLDRPSPPPDTKNVSNTNSRRKAAGKASRKEHP